MKKKFIQLLLIVAAVAAVPMRSPGVEKYTNPIICADYSDPDAIRVGDDYWLTASSFANTPGLPILHSTDLVNWEVVNHAIDRVPPYDFYGAEPQHGKGVWAPSIRFHEGTYYIYWGDPDHGIYMTSTADPRGKWSEPVLVKGGRGMIDPVPLWDEDGRVYLAHAWANSRVGFNSVINVMELSADGSSALSEPVMVIDGNTSGNHTIEGPKLYKRDGWYYIFAPAGGVAEGWQLVARSRDIYGPYEIRTVMAQGKSDINGPHQGAWVDTPGGEDWFLNFQDLGLYGRVLHLNPMKWSEGWPLIGRDTGDGSGIGEPVRSYRMPVKGTRQERPVSLTDSFAIKRLDPRWEWSGQREDRFGFGTNMGFYRLISSVTPIDNQSLWNVPNLLLQKFPGEAFTATAEVKVSAKEISDGVDQGLVLFGRDYGYIAVHKGSNGFSVVTSQVYDAENGVEEIQTVAEAELPTHRYEAGLYDNVELTVWLRATVRKGGEARFYYSLDGNKYTELGKPFKCREGKWVGAKVGLFSRATEGNDRGWMDIYRFTIDF